jgi:zeaxanthin glucosyltransferase
MTRFGLFCPAAIGHLNPMATLGLELQRRGHEVVLFGVADALKKMNGTDLRCVALGAEDFPPGSFDEALRAMGRRQGLAGLQISIDLIRPDMRMLFREAPRAVTDAGIEMLIVDQVTMAMGTVADRLSLPFVTVCNALALHQEAAVPPYFTHWLDGPGALRRWRNQAGYLLLSVLLRPVWQDLQAQRHTWNLPALPSRNAADSPLAQIAQLTQEFDFPRQRLPANFHYIGRLEDPSGLEPVTSPGAAFPFEKLDGRPLIYASLGTVQNQRPDIYACIARACMDREAQLVISLGGVSAGVVRLPGNPIVVTYAPQQQLISRAHMVITHAGMNTMLTALGCGVPVVAIPLTNEQPGIAARVERSGAGERILPNQLDAPRLRKVITKVLQDAHYRRSALHLQQSILSAGGVVRAAEIIEAAYRNSMPDAFNASCSAGEESSRLPMG